VYLNAAQETTLDFVLAKAAFQLEAVVTTATGQQHTRELGNSIAKIETAKLVQEQPITAMQDVLNGRTAGVTLIQSNGTVGGGSRVRVRGISSASLSNDPLVIVDGVRVENGSPNINPTTVGQTGVGGGRPSFLNNLHPEEIESIEIVKGRRPPRSTDAVRERRHRRHHEAWKDRRAAVGPLRRAGLERRPLLVPGPVLQPRQNDGGPDDRLCELA
jgi:outer membrane receptor protein involved in Fe transport